MKLSIADLYEGAAIEAADQELQKVLDNIMDPNTDPKTQRKVNLEIRFKPNKERNLSEVYISATSKLAPDLPIETAVLVDHQRGKGIGQELKPGQGAPGQAKLPMDNVTPLREAKND
jgi:hypothetical protein